MKLLGVYGAAALSVGGIAWWLSSPTSVARPTRTDTALPASDALPLGTGASDRPIEPIAPASGLDARRVALGRTLFHDRRFGRDQTMSCATCHSLAEGGIDRRTHQLDDNAEAMNTPTVFNSSLNFRQFWDGRAHTLEDQIDGPVHNPREMGSSWPLIVGRLRADGSYPARFAELYPEGISERSIKDAIATFERSLVTTDSRFDRWLRGEENALTAEEKEGYELFRAFGCASCHQGANAGGNMYATLGAMEDYLGARKKIAKRDLGRVNLTGDERDRFKFRVPSLRLVTRTAPYFHDGSVESLEEAVAIMARYQLGRPISDLEIRRIVQFLDTLVGTYQGKQL